MKILYLLLAGLLLGGLIDASQPRSRNCYSPLSFSVENSMKDVITQLVPMHLERARKKNNNCLYSALAQEALQAKANRMEANFTNGYWSRRETLDVCKNDIALMGKKLCIQYHKERCRITLQALRQIASAKNEEDQDLVIRRFVDEVKKHRLIYFDEIGHLRGSVRSETLHHLDNILGCLSW